jgi:hypothetical protein
MRELGNLDKKIVMFAILSIISVLAFSLVYPVISKKPNVTGKKVTSNGAINGRNDIEIYSDQKGTKRISSIVWGSLEPGINKSITVFVRNNMKNPITLAFYASNWRPSDITNYLNIKWDYNGQNIKFKEIIQIVFTLSVSKNVNTNETFSFDLTIIANG